MENTLCNRHDRFRGSLIRFLSVLGRASQVSCNASAHLEGQELHLGKTNPCIHTLYQITDANPTQIILVMLFGYGSFGTGVFWISLYMQNVLGYSPLTVAVHLIPQAVTGVIANAFAGLVLHRINNKVLMGISSVSYLAAALLLSLMKGDNVYWAFIFPALILAVIGADLQFNIANVSCPHSHSSRILDSLTGVDVRHVVSPSGKARSWRWYSEHCD